MSNRALLWWNASAIIYHQMFTIALVILTTDEKWLIAQDLVFDTKAEYSLGVIVAEDAVGVCLLTYLAELL